jgi:hypothetical protein
VLLALVWWPDGAWRPYDKDDKGTLQETVSQVLPVGKGTPLFRSLLGGDGGGSGTDVPAGDPLSPPDSSTGSGGGVLPTGVPGGLVPGGLPTGQLPGTDDLPAPVATVEGSVDPPDPGGVPAPGATASGQASAPTSTSSPQPTASASADPTTPPVSPTP